MNEIFNVNVNANLNMGSEFGVQFISYQGATDILIDFNMDDFANEMVELTEVHKAENSGRYYYYFGFIVNGQLFNEGSIVFESDTFNSAATFNLAFVNPDQIQEYAELQEILNGLDVLREFDFDNINLQYFRGRDVVAIPGGTVGLLFFAESNELDYQISTYSMNDYITENAGFAQALEGTNGFYFFKSFTINRRASGYPALYLVIENSAQFTDAAFTFEFPGYISEYLILEEVIESLPFHQIIDIDQINAIQGYSQDVTITVGDEFGVLFSSQSLYWIDIMSMNDWITESGVYANSVWNQGLYYTYIGF